MTVNEFIEQREKDWQRLDLLVNQQRGRKPLSAQDVHDLGTLYRAVASDLALARRDFPDQRVTVFLNQLLTRAHSAIYRPDAHDYGRLVSYFTHRIPQVFRESGLFTLAAFLLFMIPAVIGYRVMDVSPNQAELFGLGFERQVLANHDTWTDIPVEQRPYASAFIMSNNIRIAILAFGGGAAFGVFTVYVLVMNGLTIGAVMGLAAHYGMGQSLLTFVIGHGVIELSVIFIAGGAGLQLGWALVNPGSYRRRDALALAARRAVTLVAVGIPLLVIAGLIEGFLSPTHTPFSVHAAIGIGTGILLYGYLGLSGRPAQVDSKTRTLQSTF